MLWKSWINRGDRGSAGMDHWKESFSHEKLSAELYARTRQAHGGIAQQAIAAVENALVDLKARSLGVPVYELLGGAVGKNFLLLVTLWKLPVAPNRGDARCYTADLP